MKTLFVILLLTTSLAAHDLATTDREVLRVHILDEWKREHIEVASTASVVQLAAADDEGLPALHEARSSCTPQMMRAVLPEKS